MSMAWIPSCCSCLSLGGLSSMGWGQTLLVNPDHAQAKGIGHVDGAIEDVVEGAVRAHGAVQVADLAAGLIVDDVAGCLLPVSVRWGERLGALGLAVVTAMDRVVAAASGLTNEVVVMAKASILAKAAVMMVMAAILTTASVAMAKVSVSD